MTSSGTFPVKRVNDDSGVRRLLSSLPPPPTIPAARLQSTAPKAPAPVVRARLRPITDADALAAEEREWMALFAEAKRALTEAEEAEWLLRRTRAEEAVRAAEEREWAMLREKAHARYMHASHGQTHARSHATAIAWP